jgi:hypothetical protein
MHTQARPILSELGERLIMVSFVWLESAGAIFDHENALLARGRIATKPTLGICFKLFANH